MFLLPAAADIHGTAPAAPTASCLPFSEERAVFFPEDETSEGEIEASCRPKIFLDQIRRMMKTLSISLADCVCLPNLVWAFGGWLQRQVTAVKIREDDNGFTEACLC